MILRDGPYEVHVHEDIGEVPPHEWNGLLQPGDVVASHRFVSACQAGRVAEARFRHVLIYRHGRLVATASLSLMRVRLELLSSNGLRTTVRRMRRVFPSFLQVPFLFCGLPVSTGQSSLRIAPEADASAVMAVLCTVMDRIGKQLGAQVYCFKDLTASQASRVASLGRHGYIRAHSLPNCVLPIPWSSFEDYLAQMRSGYRRQARADLAVREAADLEFDTLDDFGSVRSVMVNLYEEVMDRAPYQLERLELPFFEQVDRQMGSCSWALLLKKEGTPIASALMLEDAGVLTFLFVGIDYAVNRSYHAYFNLLLEMVAEAIRRGATQLILGQTSYACKQRLGARPVPRYLFLKHRSPQLHALLRATVDQLFPPTQTSARRVFKTDFTTEQVEMLELNGIDRSRPVTAPA